METVVIKNFAAWRTEARYLLSNKIIPANIQWLDTDSIQASLFQGSRTPPTIKGTRIRFTTTQRFLQLAERVACHRDSERWSLLYQALWRMQHEEPYLLQLTSDPLVHRLLALEKRVNRDIHKLKAFVRFRLEQINQQPYYIAWYRPDYLILRLTANFFLQRFSCQRWSIITPKEAVNWDGERLQYAEGAYYYTANTNDPIEELWGGYYQAIFNPTRVKLKAMYKEMPVRFWPNLPETKYIPSMLQAVPERLTAMVKQHTSNATIC